MIINVYTLHQDVTKLNKKVDRLTTRIDFVTWMIGIVLVLQVGGLWLVLKAIAT